MPLAANEISFSVNFNVEALLNNASLCQNRKLTAGILHKVLSNVVVIRSISMW